MLIQEQFLMSFITLNITIQFQKPYLFSLLFINNIVWNRQPNTKIKIGSRLFFLMKPPSKCSKILKKYFIRSALNLYKNLWSNIHIKFTLRVLFQQKVQLAFFFLLILWIVLFIVKF